MTRTHHDQFAKQLLTGLLLRLGTVQPQMEVRSEVRAVDVWFVPAGCSADRSGDLGLLGRMAESACLFEPFRSPPGPSEVRDCLGKLFDLHAELRRAARRQKQPAGRVALPRLWILTPSASARCLAGFGAAQGAGGWPDGVLFLAPSLGAAFVLLEALPRTAETLWLRLLGRGRSRASAIEEVQTLPSEHPWRRFVLELVVQWRRLAEETPMRLTKDDQELLAQTRELYEEWERQVADRGRKEGRKEGQEEGRKEVVENLLRAQHGELDHELQRILPSLLALPAGEVVREILSRSREQLVARHAHSAPEGRTEG
jgi:hypothetical protein